MEKENKYYKEIEEKLNTKDNTQILKVLSEIRVSGKANILPLIFNMLSKNKNQQVSLEAFSILGQLKDKSSPKYIIEAIESEVSDNYKKELITTCWQSGLNYSSYLDTFARQFIQGDYQIAIEAFTVIEEWIPEAENEYILACKNLLISEVSNIDTEKKPLYVELVKLVESYL
ncbi:MAG: hypothetical protein JXA77_10410 [Bacteroidales bacterium]|nr:hypothetical protein [Bacteroidales bacterium]MBN2817884.1 hypothetical protein [Bacteroidales bacterium]